MQYINEIETFYYRKNLLSFDLQQYTTTCTTTIIIINTNTPIMPIPMMAPVDRPGDEVGVVVGSRETN